MNEDTRAWLELAWDLAFAVVGVALFIVAAV